MKENKLLEIVLSSIVGLVLFALYFYVLIKVGPLSHDAIRVHFPKIVLVITTIIMIFVATAIHEAGHLIAGLLQGFRFQIYVVGFFGVKRNEKDKVMLYFNTNPQLFGGVAGTIPINDDNNNADKFANVIIAGPVASLFFSLFCLIGVALIKGLLSDVLAIAGIISFAIFLATTIPSSTGFFFTDRKRYQRLKSKGKEKDTEMALLRILARQERDHSILSVQLEDIEKVRADDKLLFKFTACCFLVQYYMEKGSDQLQEAKREFDLMAKSVPRSLVRMYTQELDLLERDLKKNKEVQAIKKNGTTC